MTAPEAPGTADPTPAPPTPSPGPPGRGATIAGLAAAALGGGGATLAAWFVLDRLDLPAANTSEIAQALATLSLVALVAVVALVVWRRLANPAAPRWLSGLAEAAAALAPAGLIVATLAVPLSATPFYLEGLRIDQGFRTEYLTRLTDTARLEDMSYEGLPTHYPAGWFWLGGRLANLLGLEAWQAFQPWALASIAAAACAGVVAWRRITGSLPLAAAAGLATTATVIALNPEEPYAAIVALGAAPAAAIALRALSGGRFAAAGLLVYLGLSATIYTLFTGVVAVSLTVLALVLAARRRSLAPIARVAVIGAGSLLIAAPAWLPYLLAVVGGHPSAENAAQQYLPEEGTVLSTPFFEFDAFGLLCLAGLVTMLLARKRPAIASLGAMTALYYGWEVASLLVTPTGTTLLGFRVGLLIAAQFAAAGGLGAVYAARWALGQLAAARPEPAAPAEAGDASGAPAPEPAGRSAGAGLERGVLAGAAVVAIAGAALAQAVPAANEMGINRAYEETAPGGERADRHEPGSAAYYDAIDEEIRSHGYEPSETVVHTAVKGFASLYPYRVFQASSPHYANPLGEHPARNEELQKWAEASYSEAADPAEFLSLIDSSRWRAPDVFIFRDATSEDVPEGNTAPGDRDEPAAGVNPDDPNAGDVDAGFGTRDELADHDDQPIVPSEQDADYGYRTEINVNDYPSVLNVRTHELLFNPAAFDDEALWHRAEIGPFVVLTRA